MIIIILYLIMAKECNILHKKQPNSTTIEGMAMIFVIFAIMSMLVRSLYNCYEKANYGRISNFKVFMEASGDNTSICCFWIFKNKKLKWRKTP